MRTTKWSQRIPVHLNPTVVAIRSAVLNNRETEIFRQKVSLEIDGGQLLLIQCVLQQYGGYILPMHELMPLMDKLKELADAERPSDGGNEGI